MQCVETIRDVHGGTGCNVRESSSTQYVQPHVAVSALILYQLQSKSREAARLSIRDSVNFAQSAFNDSLMIHRSESSRIYLIRI